MVRMLRDILNAIADKTGYSKRHVRRLIDRIIKESGYTIPNKRIAANILASKLEIEINRLLSAEELAEVRRYLTEPVVSSIVIKVKSETGARVLAVNEGLVRAFRLPRILETEAIRMSKVYPRFYIFENLLRHIIMKTLETMYGNDWWRIRGIVSRNIKDKVRVRMKAEGEKRWHGMKRGGHEVFYTDLGDLGSIIVNNHEIFKGIFGSVDTFRVKLREIEDIRNIIAHNNPLPAHEIRRLRMYSDDLTRQIVSQVEQ